MKKITVRLDSADCDALQARQIETEGKKVSGKRIKNKFVQSSKPIEFVFPPKWGIGNLK